MSILLGSVIGLPLLAGAAMAVGGRQMSAGEARRVATVVLLLTAGGLLLLAWFAEPSLSIEFVWLPGAGALSIGAATTGLYAALATTLGGLVALWARPRREPDESPLLIALLLLAAAAAHAAFLSGHFLGRYVALEGVALCVMLAPLVDARLSRRMAVSLCVVVLVLLRVGDAGLLAAILLLFGAGGTLDIASALSAAPTLTLARSLWVGGGFLLAVWVKVGLWPFHLWLHAGHRLPFVARAWLYATVLPSLGLYLLYRVAPLLVDNEILRMAMFGIGIGGVAMMVGLAALRSTTGGWSLYLQAALAGASWIMAAMGDARAVWVSLLVWTPLRLLLVWIESGRAAQITEQEAFGAEDRWIDVLLDGAQWEYRFVEQPLGGLDRRAAQGLMVGGQVIYHWVEQKGLEGLLRGTAGLVLRLSRRVQRAFTGQLRQNLLWIAISLIVAVLALLWAQG